jgi:multisubunit Na+/H+ antiporter MnhF subunit
VYAPALKLAGLTLLSTGVAFHSVTALVPLAPESATDAALIVIVLGFVGTAGAV